jgi:colanic acid biosynthesis glycosyl transferase WcaI
MRILLVSQHFPPEIAATGRRAMDLAEEFTGLGHDVAVVTGRPNHPATARIAVSRRDGSPVTNSRYPVHRVRVWRTSWAGPFQRMLTYGTFTVRAAWRAARLARQADIVVAISPLPTGLAGLVASSFRGKPLIFDLQDIWPESAHVCGVLREGMLLRRLRWVEACLYRRCAAVTVITPGFRSYVMGHGIGPDRVHVVHNGVEAGLFEGMAPDRAFLSEHGLEGKFIVLYFGNVGLAQNLETLLRAAESLKGEEGLVFVILGDGVDKARLMEWTASRGLRNCRFVATQPRQRLPGIVAAAHILVVMLRQAKIFEITIPSKLYECLAAGKPIMCGVAGDAAEIVHKAGGGVTVPPDDVSGVVQAIQIIRNDYPRFTREAAQAREYVRRHYSRDQIGARFAEICREAIVRWRQRS